MSDNCDIINWKCLRKKLGLKEKVKDWNKLRKSVEMQSKLDSISLTYKFLDPITFMTWGIGVLIPIMCLGIYIGWSMK